MTKKFEDSRFTIDMQETGKRLKEFRILRHIKLIELSEQTGLSMAMISETEGGKNKPSPNLMLAMNRLYGLDINWLLTGEGTPELKKPPRKLPKNEKGEINYDIDTLLWLMERVPVIKYAVLSFFAGYYFEHRQIIEKFLDSIEKKNNAQNEKGDEK